MDSLEVGSAVRFELKISKSGIGNRYKTQVEVHRGDESVVVDNGIAEITDIKFMDNGVRFKLKIGGCETEMELTKSHEADWSLAYDMFPGPGYFVISDIRFGGIGKWIFL